MGLLLPSNNNKKLGVSYWTRVLILLGFISVLTWYGKFFKPQPVASRDHGLAVWTFPHARGLGVLVVLPDDGNDSNQVRTGLRLWLNPPREPGWVAQHGGIRYRGGSMVVIHDSLPLVSIEQMAQSIDTGGHLLWLGLPGWPERLVERAVGPRRFTLGIPSSQPADWLGAFSGRDSRMELVFLGDDAQDYLLNWECEGYRFRFWSSAVAFQADTLQDSLSVGVFLYPLDILPDSPRLRQVGSLIWKGAVQGQDSSRLALNQPESMALAATAPGWKTLKVRRLHLKGWNPDMQ